MDPQSIEECAYSAGAASCISDSGYARVPRAGNWPGRQCGGSQKMLSGGAAGAAADHLGRFLWRPLARPLRLGHYREAQVHGVEHGDEGF